jgi:hypothetical protein
MAGMSAQGGVSLGFLAEIFHMLGQPRLVAIGRISMNNTFGHRLVNDGNRCMEGFFGLLGLSSRDDIAE